MCRLMSLKAGDLASPPGAAARSWESSTSAQEKVPQRGVVDSHISQDVLGPAYKDGRFQFPQVQRKERKPHEDGGGINDF